MAKLTINLGTNPNDGTGDNLRGGGTKINANFDEIYAAIGDGSNLTSHIKFADDTSTVATIGVGNTLKVSGGSGIDTTISGDTLTIATDNTIMTESGTVTMTNKSMALSSNTLTGTTAEFNTALTDDDFATLNNSVSLTNKNLTSLTNTFPGITIVDDSSTSSLVNLGETLKITGSGGATSTISGDTVTISVANLTNTNLSGSAGITNANLANSSVTIGADTISLGDTQTTITDLNLDGTSSLSGTGTIDQTGSGSKVRHNFSSVSNFPSETTYSGMFAFSENLSELSPYVASASGWIRILTENDSVSRHPDVTISGIANGNILVWNSSLGRFEPGVAGSGSFSAGNDLDQAGADIQDVGYVSHRSPDSTVTQTLLVTAATKTTEHTAYGDGSSTGYLIDGHEGAHLQLSRGTYKFDMSDSSNIGHPLRFYYDEAKTREMTAGSTNNDGTSSPGSAGAFTQIVIDDNTPTPLFYQCTNHANMGGRIDIMGGKRTRLNVSTDKSNTGDGTTTGYTILANRTVDDILVFVNGICLVPTDDYTISGTTLTLISAPTVGAEIVIRYLG